MKQKKHSKLSFSKATVANLNIPQMKDVVGGDLTDTCPSLDPPTCKPVICEPSLECPTPNTDYSWCICTGAIC